MGEFRTRFGVIKRVLVLLVFAQTLQVSQMQDFIVLFSMCYSMTLILLVDLIYDSTLAQSYIVISVQDNSCRPLIMYVYSCISVFLFEDWTVGT